MSVRPATSSTEPNTRSAHLVVPDAPVRLVTVIVGIVVGLTFLFGFGNVATLGALTPNDGGRCRHAQPEVRT